MATTVITPVRHLTKTPRIASRSTSVPIDIYNDESEHDHELADTEDDNECNPRDTTEEQDHGAEELGPDNTALLPASQWQTLTPGYFAKRVTERLDAYERDGSFGSDDEDDDTAAPEYHEQHDEDEGYGLAQDEAEEDDFDETDPFEDEQSEIDEDAVHEEKLTAQNAHGLFHVFRPVAHSREVSHATAIHLNSPTSFSTSQRSHQPRSSCDNESLSSSSHKIDLRKASNNTAFSSMPDELSYYQSSIPHRHMRSPLAESPSSINRNNATPSGAFTPLTPLTKRRQMHSRMGSGFENGKENSGRSGFRNPSSVRAMQLSSPSPPPMTSASRRRRMLTSQDGPDEGRSTPSKHSNPRKEYPLVLLHCTIHPTLSYSSDIIKEVIGEDDGIARDAELLEERLSDKVLERGVLISHPGDEYELLEERVLESLELKRPSIGGCGHFHEGLAVSLKTKEAAPEENEKSTLDEDLGRKKCIDCGKHVSHTLLQDPHISQSKRLRRWDIRVYASNGLMRAGAWTAAWREMEKVDVEVGVWMSEPVKRRLDDKMSQLRQEEEQAYQDTESTRYSRRRPLHSRSVTATTTEHFASAAAPGTPASRAACSRAPSLDFTKAGQQRDDAPLREPATRLSDQSSHRNSAASAEVPLTTLVRRYLQRQLQSKHDFLLPVLVLMLGLALAGKNLLSSSAPRPEPLLNVVSTSTKDGHSLSDAPQLGSSIKETQKSSVAFDNLPICAFKPQDVEDKQMVAMEWTSAQRCLQVEDGNTDTLGIETDSDSDSETVREQLPDASKDSNTALSEASPDDIGASSETAAPNEDASGAEEPVIDARMQTAVREVAGIAQQVLEVAAPLDDSAEME